MEYKTPLPPEKKQKFRWQIVESFLKKHKSYEVESVDGPWKISNFRGPQQSEGEWILKVKKKATQPRRKSKTPPTKTKNKKEE